MMHTFVLDVHVHTYLQIKLPVDSTDTTFIF